jgi:hypothetical protein
MNDTQLLERLTSAYATVDAPAPSAALAAVLDTGGVADDDERDDAVVLPFVAPVRPATNMKLRARHLVAAMVATFVLFSGLAVAGALPDAIQREVSSVVSHLGIDLPDPQPSSAGGGGSDAPHDQDHPQTTTTSPGGAIAGPGGSSGTPVGSPAGGTTPLGTPAGSATTAAPGVTTPGGAGTGTGAGDGGTSGGSGGTPTTLLPAGGGSILPPISLPPISLPPIDLPGLPPITVAPITLPPITLPFGL